MGKLYRYSRFAVFLLCSCLSSLAHSSEVEFFSPSGEVKKVRQVAVRFAEQMVSFGDPREVDPFDIFCPAHGRGRWADQKNWIYDFDSDLHAGITCTFTLKKGLVSTGGKPIQGGEQFSFNTGGPAIIQSEPNEYVPIDENQIFILGLDGAASADSIKQHAACLVEGMPEQIPVRLVTGDERKQILDLRPSFMTSYFSAIFKRGRGAGQPVILGVEERGSERAKFLKMRDAPNSPIVVLQCQRTLPNDATVRLLWDKGILSLSGLPTSAPQTLPFKTRSVFDAKFSCDRVNKDAGCIPALPMNLTFSGPIKTSDAENIRLVPAKGKPIPAAISKEDRKNGFLESVTFPTPLPEQTDFKIVIPNNLRDDAGRVLANAGSFPLAVRTDENPPLAKFAASFGILELNASPAVPPLLPVTLRNVEPELAGNIAGATGEDAGEKPIGGRVMHGASERDVVSWLRRLEAVDRGAFDDDDSGPGKRSVFEDSDNLIPIKVPKQFGGKAFEVVGIPLNGPGFYVVELASPRLGESLFDEKRPYYVHAAALVTNLSVHFKQGRESSLVWVTSLDKGSVVQDADIAVRDCAGKIYYQGSTDAQGLLRIEKELPEENSLPVCTSYERHYYVTARKGKDFSFVFSNWNEGIALWRFNAFQDRWEGHNIAHAVMDRTLVRTSETVHMKIFLRRRTRDGFAEADFTPPEKITIVHQGGEEKYEAAVKWDGRGIATLDWKVPADAKQGTYAVMVPEGRAGMKSAGDFRVESFRVPTMKAIMQGPGEPLVNAEQATIGIQINYLAGGGATNLPVKLRGQLLPKSVAFLEYEDYTFANGSVQVGPEKIGSEPWYMGDYELTDGDGEEDEAPVARASMKASGQMLPVQNFQLNAAGSGQATFSKLPRSPEPRTIQAELEYRDPNGETLSASTRIPLWPSRVVVGIKPEGWIATADHLKFYTVVLDLKGNPVANAKVSVEALQREYFSHRRRLLGGFYAFENRSEIKSLGPLCQGTTDSKGLLICEVKAPASGNIILQARTDDAAGNPSLANREIWVAGSGDWWFDASDNDRVDLLPEKKRYEPGETARFQLRMPFKEATVLVTTEREGVMESFVTHVTRDHAFIEVPIRKNYSPNVFVSALAVRGRLGDVQPTAMVDLGKPSFKMGLAEIKVGWAAHELKVKVATDKQAYKVREKAKVSVDVRRFDGSLPPPGSEIALVAVDEGLLELKPNDSWGLLDAMMQRRGIEVTTSTAQMQVIGKRHFGRKALAAGGGGGGGRKSVRELFDTLLFWQARVKLDDHGHAEAQIPLNDSLTSFRIVAVADGDLGLFGTGSASITSSQDLMLLSGLPPVVREQDRYRADFTVRNASDHPIEATVTASIDDGIEHKTGSAPPLAPITVNLQKGEARELGWVVNAPVGSKALKWDVAVREKGKNEDGDHIRISQKVIPAIPVRTLQATLMQLEKPESIKVKIPDGAIPGRGGVRINFRKRLSDGLAGVQEYMTRYPYTCFEQNASKAVALQDEEAWNSLMGNLYSYLDRDGLVKYFPIMYEGDDTLTAYILSIGDEAGYKIPEYAQGRMVSGLKGFVEGRVIRYSALPSVDLNIRKIAAIAALSRMDEINPKWLDSIAIEPNLWPTSAVLDWLYILKKTPGLANQPELLNAAQQIIRSRLNFQGTTMGFSTERSDALWWLMINSDVNANRALLTFLDMDGWGPDIPRLVQGTLGRQQQGHWNTTVANAWGVLAMKKFSEKFESEPVSGITTATIANEKFAADWGKGANGAQGMLAWPEAAASLTLNHNGGGKPWATIQSLAALPLKKPLFTGYRVARQVIPVEQKTPGTWHKGDVARIHLDIDAQSDMTWVVVNDPIPSGASILGTGLGGDSQILTGGEKKQGWVWPAFEERTFDSFRSYYRFVPKGKMSVEYTLRLNSEGEFNLPTTRVEAMYAPEMFGELPNDKFVVLP